MPHIKWSAPALRDLTKIDAYYLEIDADLADRIGAAAIGAAQFLAEHPLAGPIVEKTDKRKWVVRGTPYILLYRPETGGVRIVRIRHMAEDWKPKS